MSRECWLGLLEPAVTQACGRRNCCAFENVRAEWAMVCTAHDQTEKRQTVAESSTKLHCLFEARQVTRAALPVRVSGAPERRSPHRGIFAIPPFETIRRPRTRDKGLRVLVPPLVARPDGWGLPKIRFAR
jgi:hypothetical protein